MTSKVSKRFWKQWHELPKSIQELSYKNYLLWLKDPRHPSIHFKPFHSRLYSVRVGEHYRAVGYFSGPNEFTWIWIGSHEDYNHFLK
jgi:mRNA-degrading endonuclease RelE of RelBE toxin-antitoxin system